jgi:hypothetical protein
MPPHYDPKTFYRTDPAIDRSTVVIPTAVQAFVVGEDFKDTAIQVAPLLQPDRTKLQPKSGYIAHDLMDDLDISAVRLKAAHNTRFTDVLTGETRSDRTGVYVSWCLPRVYRTGITATGGMKGSSDYGNILLRSGYKKPSDNTNDTDSDVQVSAVL